MLRTRAYGRRFADACVAGLTWVATAGVILWFYDWVNRWYIAVGVIGFLVVTIMLADRVTPAASQPALALLAAIPAQREPELGADSELEIDEREVGGLDIPA